MSIVKGIWLAMAVAGLLTGPSWASVIYSDDFSGDGSSNLVGTSPDVTPDSETWSGFTAGTLWMNNGSITTNNNQRRNVFLPFTPEAGKEYTLKIDVVRIGTTDSFAFGFTETNTGNAGFPLLSDGLNASPWMTSYGINGKVDTFTGPANGGAGGQVSVASADAFNTLEMVLNTENPAWTVEFFLNGTSIRTETFSANPNINYVGFGRYNTGTFTVDNFELSVVPEPVTIGFLGSGGLVLLLFRRRFQQL